MPKTRLQKKIDAKLIAKSSGTGAPSSGAATPDIAPPAPPSIAAPDNLSLSTSIGSSTAAPTAIISATWDAPPGTIPQGSVVQASTGSGYAAAATITLNTIERSETSGPAPSTTCAWRRVFRAIRAAGATHKASRARRTR